MAYAKIINNAVSQYPYTRQDLYNDYPDIDQKVLIPQSELPEGIVIVNGQVPSSYDAATQKFEYAGQPTLIDGEWQLAITVFNKTDAEMESERLAQKQYLRERRNTLLAETDWWANSDVTMTDEQRAYRQALRDIPLQEGFPHSVTWPTKPE